MSFIINLGDLDAEGLPIEYEVQPSDIDLSPGDGEIAGSLTCLGHVFPIEGNLANFEGSLTGKVIRECVRCLTRFEDNISLSLNAQFKESNHASVAPVSSKRTKKGGRRKNSEIEDEYENELDSYPIKDNQIDLLPVLRENLILATPLQTLCRESCSGLCQECGSNLNEGVCGCCSPVEPSSLIQNIQNPIGIKI